MSEAKSALNVVFSSARMNVIEQKKKRNTEGTLHNSLEKCSARSLYALSSLFSPKERKVRCNVKK